jgi:hypothetical protein
MINAGMGVYNIGLPRREHTAHGIQGFNALALQGNNGGL